MNDPAYVYDYPIDWPDQQWSRNPPPVFYDEPDTEVFPIVGLTWWDRVKWWLSPYRSVL